MTDIVRVQLTKENRAVLEQLNLNQATKLEQIINQALHSYLVGVRFEQLRERLNQTDDATPVYSEAEIFEIVS